MTGSLSSIINHQSSIVNRQSSCWKFWNLSRLNIVISMASSLWRKKSPQGMLDSSWPHGCPNGCFGLRGYTETSRRPRMNCDSWEAEISWKLLQTPWKSPHEKVKKKCALHHGTQRPIILETENCKSWTLKSPMIFGSFVLGSMDFLAPSTMAMRSFHRVPRWCFL